MARKTWALPTPGLWNKLDISGNTLNADGIRPERLLSFLGFEAVPVFPFL